MKKQTKPVLNIAHLYPNSMNIYGDKGNIITLVKRAKLHGFKTNVTEIKLGDKLNSDQFDLFFAGGGQDLSQIMVAKDLQEKKQEIKKAVDKNKVFLLICGTYQLFGKYFLTFDNKKIPGISILDIYTIAGKKRKIGNVICKLSPLERDRLKVGMCNQESLLNSRHSEDCNQSEESGSFKSNFLVGFENHSGNTYIEKDSDTKPLGGVVSGFGNNDKAKYEGAVYHNCFGTYLHGSLLPKNPHFADFLIKTALENKYKKEIKLKNLNDSLEQKAHNFILQNRK